MSDIEKLTAAARHFSEKRIERDICGYHVEMTAAELNRLEEWLFSEAINREWHIAEYRLRTMVNSGEFDALVVEAVRDVRIRAFRLVQQWCSDNLGG